VKVNLTIPEGLPLVIELPFHSTVRDLKGFLLCKSADHEIQHDGIALIWNSTVLADDAIIRELGDSVYLQMRKLAPHPNPESPDISVFIRRLREATREEVPLAKQRHKIQEQQRQATNAVTNAFARVPVADQELHDLKFMESDMGGVENLGELREALGSLMDQIDSHDKELTAVNRVCSCVLASIAASSASRIPRSGVGNDSDVSVLIGSSPVDLDKLACAIVDICNRESNVRIPSRSISQLLLGLTDAVMKGSRQEVAESLINVAHELSVGESLLPAPIEKAILSPEILRWAQGLRPIHK